MIRVAALAGVLAIAAAGCGSAHGPAFCGLVHTVNGFDPVEAVHGISCAAAEQAVVAIERGGSGWDCSRAMHASYELDCLAGRRELRVLEEVPGKATRHGRAVVLAGWTFRIARGHLFATDRATLDLGAAPWCVTDAPRQALVALGLRRTTPTGGCFGFSSRASR
ncbi:MAG TPA: hypothetical protein VJP39_06535 [Gaiellaceae bacterium]|nr:hypothetical protein [Gaiellaceae bacterium]